MADTVSSETDASIVARVIHGDIDAYAEIMHRYQTKLHRYVTFLIHNHTTATDVAQDTFIKAYENLRSYSPEYKFSSWIYRIAHNEAMNAVKKNRRLSDQDIDTLPDLDYDQHLDELVDKELLKEHVHGCLDKLGPKYRDVVQLAYFEHMKYDEISDILRIPTSTVGVRLSRAKLQLKKVCTEKGVKQ
jgi:RNA polymerase sigma-70 factor (ECF subfamily)